MRVLGVHCGWIIVLVLVVFMHVYMNHTKHGYEIAVIGDSINTASKPPAGRRCPPWRRR